MKKLFLAAALAATLSPSVAFADVNEALENICSIVKADDTSELRKKMRVVQSEYKLRLGDFYQGVSCGGLSLIRHAVSNGAIEAGELMIKKMRKSDLETPESDGQTLQQWLSTNGHAGSNLATVLAERIS